MQTGDLIKWGLIGLAGWWVYENFFNTTATATPAVAVTPTTSPTSSPAATPPATPAPTYPTAGSTAQPYTSLNSLYNALVAAAKAGMAAGDKAVTADSSGTVSTTGYSWNFYLAQIDKSINTATIPANILTGSQTYTSAQYWAAVGPWVGSTLGLSGYSLGLAGLGLHLLRNRRRFA